jgi:hypothetical protein
LSVWDDTITASGQAVDFTSADFLRVENGVGDPTFVRVSAVRFISGLTDCSI